MRALLFGLAILLVAGCSKEQKLTSTCKLAVETIVRSPGYLGFAKPEFLTSGISQSDLEKIYAERSPDERLGPETKRYLNQVYESDKNVPQQYWVDLKVSSPEINSGVESKANCRFVDRVPSKVSLVEFNIAGKSYSGDYLLNLQIQQGPPNKLTEYLF